MSKIRAGLLLLVSMMAMSAFAAPAVAQAEGPFWYVNGEKLEGEEAIEAEGEFTFTTQIGIYPAEIGPCEFTFAGTIENTFEDATGSLDSSTPPSTVCEAEFSVESGSFKCPMELAPAEFGWPITATESGIAWEGVGFWGLLGPPCPSITPGWFGTLPGSWDNPSSSFVFEEAGGLFMFPSTPVITDGEFQVTAEGGPVTLE